MTEQNPVKLVWDGETDTWSEIKLTAEELAEHQAAAAASIESEAERVAAEEAVAAKKATVLAAIAEATGLTAEDISEALA
jgi:hypothetical protein